MSHVLTTRQLRRLYFLGTSLCVLSLVCSVSSLLALRGFIADRKDRELMMAELETARVMADALLAEARALEDER